jgi:V/A-type H+/Na+-transporting ATPase subunit E
MEADLKNLIEKIKQDGVAQAETDAAKIIKDAQAKASDIINNAKQEGQAIIEGAKQDAENFKKASDTALKQAARDALLALRGRVSEFFARVVKEKVTEELNPEALKDIIVKAVEHAMKEGVAEIEVVLSDKDKKVLEKTLFGALRKEARERVLLQEKQGIKGGFRIGAKGAGSYLDFTDQAIADGFKRYLSPKLADALDIDLGLKENSGNNDK